MGVSTLEPAESFKLAPATNRLPSTSASRHGFTATIEEANCPRPSLIAASKAGMAGSRFAKQLEAVFDMQLPGFSVAKLRTPQTQTQWMPAWRQLR